MYLIRFFFVISLGFRVGRLCLFYYVISQSSHKTAPELYICHKQKESAVSLRNLHPSHRFKTVSSTSFVTILPL